MTDSFPYASNYCCSSLSLVYAWVPCLLLLLHALCCIVYLFTWVLKRLQSTMHIGSGGFWIRLWILMQSSPYCFFFPDWDHELFSEFKIGSKIGGRVDVDWCIFAVYLNEMDSFAILLLIIIPMFIYVCVCIYLLEYQFNRYRDVFFFPICGTELFATSWCYVLLFQMYVGCICINVLCIGN